MKTLGYFCLLGIMLYMISALLSSSHGGTVSEIRVYAIGRNITPVIGHLNSLVGQEAINFLLVESSREADVSVEFSSLAGHPDAAAIAYPITGQVYVSNNVSPDQIYVVLVHELLHCAGVGHEPDDPSSVMYTHSQRQGQLKQRHMSYLRGLAGKTFLGRIGAQITAML